MEERRLGMTTTETAVASRSDVGEISKEKLMQDLRTLVADAEELLKATANVQGQQIAAIRVKAEESLSAAKARLATAQASIVAKTRVAAKASDDYVRANPWNAIGIAAAAGAIIGVLIARR
jgi:ElaB/YqjD/DUF883 family membrane-anchored ribosome-binding protein